ncbi:hypothetical protein [Methanoculleus bourgensis]|nr:hypothetical protein [Methanoculleus bourgensis]
MSDIQRIVDLYRFSYLYHGETVLESLDAHLRLFNEIGGASETSRI